MMADKAKVLRLLKTARGQIDGIIKMIEEDRYCIDISNQIMASYSLLKKANLEILEGHLSHCVSQSFENNSDSEEKIDEVINLLKRMIQ